MLNLKLLFLTLILSSCATPVTSGQWGTCEALCYYHGGLKEACSETLNKTGCHCESGDIYWHYKSTPHQYDVTQPYSR